MKTIGIACLLDGELAKKYFATFVLYTSVDQKEEIFKISLMSILDMLVCYGLQHFNVENSVDMSNQKKKGSLQLFDLDKDEMDLAVSEIQKETENIVTKLIRLLDHEVKNNFKNNIPNLYSKITIFVVRFRTKSTNWYPLKGSVNFY